MQARTANEVLKAQERRVRLQRMKGELVDRAKAVAQVFRLARDERDAWVNWPARVAAMMAAELEVYAHKKLALGDHPAGLRRGGRPGPARGARADGHADSRQGVEVRLAIHPVAGRMPGHMNVLLAEANVPYDVVHELEEVNNDFQAADVALCDRRQRHHQPGAAEDPSSPIYGMPVLDVDKAKAVSFVKRSMAPGYAGIDNTLSTKTTP